jgi:hypothetical protein
MASIHHYNFGKNPTRECLSQNENHNSLNIMANQLTFMFGEKLPLRFHILREAICGSTHTSCSIVRLTEIGPRLNVFLVAIGSTVPISSRLETMRSVIKREGRIYSWCIVHRDRSFPKVCQSVTKNHIGEYALTKFLK